MKMLKSIFWRQCRPWSRRRSVIFLIVLVVLLTMMKLLTSLMYQKEEQTPCVVPSEQRKRLYRLLSSVSNLLSHLSITHFLCFESLWGAVQESGPLPWDAHAHLCALNEKVAKQDEAELLRAFRRQGLTLLYSSAEGQYTIRSSSEVEGPWVSPSVRVVLFEEDERVHMFRRVGWKRRVLPPDCDAHPTLQCFPPMLAAAPLPSRSFGPLQLPAPREDIDLLKFHYPDTWWHPLQPQC